MLFYIYILKNLDSYMIFKKDFTYYLSIRF